MSPLRASLVLLGFAAIVAIVGRLPADVFAATQSALLVAAALLFVLAGASIFLAPARRLQAAIFVQERAHVAEPALSVATPEQARGAVRPVLAAVACLAVAALAAALR